MATLKRSSKIWLKPWSDGFYTLLSQHPEKFRTERLEVLSAGTVLREAVCFSRVSRPAEYEWGLKIDDPVRAIRKPVSPLGRSRILTDDELNRLLKSA